MDVTERLAGVLLAETARNIAAQAASSLPLPEPKIYPARRMGKYAVYSLELAACIAHRHGNVLKAIRKVENRPELAGEFYATERKPERGGMRPCYGIGRRGLIAMFEHLHNLPPRCPDIGAVLARYLDLFAAVGDFETAEPEQPEPEPVPEPEPEASMGLYEEWSARSAEKRTERAARDAAKPAEPEPSPADTCEPEYDEPFYTIDERRRERAERLARSWLTNCAVERLTADPDIWHSLRDELHRWNSERCRLLYEGVLARGGSLTDAQQIFATRPMAGAPKDGDDA